MAGDAQNWLELVDRFDVPSLAVIVLLIAWRGLIILHKILLELALMRQMASTTKEQLTEHRAEDIDTHERLFKAIAEVRG